MYGDQRNVWSWRFRCMNSDTEGTPQNNKNREQFGDRVAWMKRDGSAATMQYLMESKLIDNSAAGEKPFTSDCGSTTSRY